MLEYTVFIHVLNALFSNLPCYVIYFFIFNKQILFMIVYVHKNLFYLSVVYQLQIMQKPEIVNNV